MAIICYGPIAITLKVCKQLIVMEFCICLSKKHQSNRALSEVSCLKGFTSCERIMLVTSSILLSTVKRLSSSDCGFLEKLRQRKKNIALLLISAIHWLLLKYLDM